MWSCHCQQLNPHPTTVSLRTNPHTLYNIHAVSAKLHVRYYFVVHKQLLCTVFRISVLPVPSGFCSAGAKQFDVTSSTAVSSDSLFAAGCGTSRVTFAARDGQRLNVSIVDFTRADPADNDGACVRYLSLEEEATGRYMVVCAGTERVQHVMLSYERQLKVYFRLSDAERQRFLLRIEGDDA